MAAPVPRRQRQGGQVPDRAVRAQYRVRQLAQLISSGGQAGMELAAEPRQHGERAWPGTGVLWQAVQRSRPSFVIFVLYDAVNSVRIDIARLRRCRAGLPLPRAADGRLMLAVDVSNWLRLVRPPAWTGCSAMSMAAARGRRGAVPSAQQAFINGWLLRTALS